MGRAGAHTKEEALPRREREKRESDCTAERRAECWWRERREERRRGERERKAKALCVVVDAREEGARSRVGERRGAE